MVKTKEKEKKARRAGFVYVLHFQEKLGDKAQHYIGCTADPKGRLTSHAHGQSSSIMKACKREGIEFQVGFLGQCGLKQMRRIEIQAKAWKNAKEFCEVCNASKAKTVPACTALPLEMLPFPITSQELRQNKQPPVTIQHSSRRTPLWVLDAIIRMGKEEGNALGFIPFSGLSNYLARGQVVLAQAGQEIAGFVLYGMYNPETNSIAIQQTCTADAQRGRGIGRRMIEAIQEKYPTATITAKVRDDLIANGFWQAIGFSCPKIHTHRTSANALNVWTRPGRPQAAETKKAA